MKKIQTLNVKQLRVEEDFGFHKLIMAETANLPQEESSDGPQIMSLRAASPVLDNAVSQFETAFNAFDEALKDSASNPATVTATAADEARDAAWRGANNYLTAMCAHPSADVAANAAEAKSLFDKYDDPTKLPQTEESGVLHNLLQDLNALDSGKRTALALDVWITDLQAQRTEEDAARQVGIVKETRAAADAAYRSLVDTVNALAIIEGDAEYATFIDHVNAMIDRQKAILKTRTTRAKNEEGKEEDDAPTIE